MVPYVGPCSAPSLVSALCRLRKKPHLSVPNLNELIDNTVIDGWGEPEWKDVKSNRPTPKTFPKARPHVTINLDEWLPNFTVAASDVHFPIHDQRALDGMLNLAIDLGAQHGLFPGDLYDLYALSKYSQEASRARGPDYTLQEEIDSAKPWWRNVCEIFERADYFPGNHEKRLQSFIDNNHALHGLESLKLKHVLQIPDSVNVHDFRTRIDMGPLAIEHGDELRGSGTKHSTASVLSNYPDQDTIYGHTHRLQISRRTAWCHGVPRKRMALSLGHMSRTENHLYASYPDWQQGFAVLEWYRTPDGEPRFNEHLIQVEDGRFSFGGKLYDGA